MFSDGFSKANVFPKISTKIRSNPLKLYDVLAEIPVGRRQRREQATIRKYVFASLTSFKKFPFFFAVLVKVPHELFLKMR